MNYIHSGAGGLEGHSGAGGTKELEMHGRRLPRISAGQFVLSSARAPSSSHSKDVCPSIDAGGESSATPIGLK